MFNVFSDLRFHWLGVYATDSYVVVDMIFDLRLADCASAIIFGMQYVFFMTNRTSIFQCIANKLTNTIYEDNLALSFD